jgi:heme A synthase
VRDLLLTLAAFTLALWGFALLALSQERHVERVFGHHARPAPGLRAQRATGFTAIGLGLPVCLAAEGAGFGSLLWVVLVCAAAMGIALTLTWRPRWLRARPFRCFKLRP